VVVHDFPAFWKTAKDERETAVWLIIRAAQLPTAEDDG
jgi:hypothetical protein